MTEQDSVTSGPPPTLRTAFLLLVALWSFCRLYLFLLYLL